MKTPALTALLTVSLLTSPASGTILLNEIHINPPEELDLNFEYIELRSTTDGVEACTGLTLLIIENNGGQIGELEEALSLNGLSTGANGLLLIGNAYDVAPQGGPWSGFKTPATTVGDPSASTGNPPYSGLSDDDIGPNGGLTFLLVTGWTGLATSTGGALTDVDVNNNNTLDWQENPPPAGGQQTEPFATLVDSVGFRDLDNSPARRPYTVTADLNLRTTSPATFAPDNISRRLSRAAVPADQNNANAWYGGNLGGTTNDAVAYGAQIFGDFRGQATPGQTNLDAAPAVGNFLINEVAVNPPGQIDGNFEYVEILNAGGGGASLQGLSLLVIRSNVGSSGTTPLGTVAEAWDLSAFTTGANGLLLLGNNYPDGDLPWGSYVPPETQLADPSVPNNPPFPNRYSSMGEDDLGSNNGFTLLLVQNFTGTIDRDLDTNNDGVLDVTPWTAIIDSVGFDQTEDDGTGKTYATAKLTATPHYDIDNVSRKLGNTTANVASAWYGGDYGGNSPFSIGFRDEAEHPVIGGFRGAATPGRLNLSAPPEAAAIRINEVMVDPYGENPNDDADNDEEYIEFVNASLTLGGMHGLTLVIARATGGGDNGQIVESIDLSGLSTGPNGLMLLGDSYDNSPPYNSPNKLISRLTSREDPSGWDAGDIRPNAGMIVILKKGAIPAVGSNISAIAAGDIVDSIGFGTSTNAAVTLVSPGFTPDNLSRYPGNYLPNTAVAWYSGEMDPAFGETSVYYGANFSGSYKGGASPGRANHAATPSSTATLLLNELNINPPGGDQSDEFIEFRALPAAAVSTNGYTLLLIDGTGGNTGIVVEAWSLDGLATGTNGLLMTGAGYPATSPWVGANAPAAGTRLGSPPTLAPGDIAGYSDNGTASFLLVRHFDGWAGQDLDAGVGPLNTGADNGTLDLTPWTDPIADAVGMRLWDTTLTTPTWTGRVYGGVDLSQNGYTPDNVSRDGNNTTANLMAAWYGGNIQGSTGTSTAFITNEMFPAGGFVGAVTPGQLNRTNLDDNGDEDKDGAVNLIELALNMNPAVSDPQLLPQSGTLDVGGTLYPTLTYRRFRNGTGSGDVYTANGFGYEVEASLDLINWTGVTEMVGQPTPNNDGLTESAVVRPESTYFNTALSSGGTVFLRLRITRS